MTLIWGDKKYVLPSLLPEFAGKVNLVYIDPPFDTGADFSFTAEIPDTDESVLKRPSMIEQKAYRDMGPRARFVLALVLRDSGLAEGASPIQTVVVSTSISTGTSAITQRSCLMRSSDRTPVRTKSCGSGPRRAVTARRSIISTT